MRHFLLVRLIVPPGGRFGDARCIRLSKQAMSIGRSETAEISVDVAGVDEVHGEITEEYFVARGADCAIGDVPMEPGQRRALTDGDEIQMGSVVLTVEADSAPELTHPRLRVVEGQDLGETLTLAREHHDYVIGRSGAADLSLTDREVSREHLKVAWRGAGVFVFDAASTRGSWLGRAAVYQGSLVEWTRPRMLKVGATVLALELPRDLGTAARAPSLAGRSASLRPFSRARTAWKARANAKSSWILLGLLGLTALALLFAVVALFVWTE